MKMIRYILLSVACLVSIAGSAQISVHIDPTALDPFTQQSHPFTDGTAASGIPFTVTITNQSNFDLNSGSLTFGYSVTRGGITTANTSDLSDTSGFYFPQTALQLTAGSSVSYSVIAHFSTPAFVIGSSTVVIWPIITGQPVTVDSARGVIEVTARDTTTTGINDPISGASKVYLSGSYLIINGIQNGFGELRIYNTIGQQVYTQKISGESRIPMQSFAPGIYVIEATLNDGRHILTRVLKAE